MKSSRRRNRRHVARKGGFHLFSKRVNPNASSDLLPTPTNSVLSSTSLLSRRKKKGFFPSYRSNLIVPDNEQTEDSPSPIEFHANPLVSTAANEKRRKFRNYLEQKRQLIAERQRKEKQLTKVRPFQSEEEQDEDDDEMQERLAIYRDFLNKHKQLQQT